MADLTEQIKITGGEAIAATFADIARAGEQAFQRIDKAASTLNIDSSVRNIETAAKRAGVSFQEMEQRVRGASQTIGTIAPAFATASTAVHALERETARTTNSLGAFATALRQIGRATGERELGRLSAVVRLLGNNIAGIVVAGAVVGLGAIAQSAAAAATSILNAAQAANAGTDSFQRFTAIGTQTGASLDQIGQAAIKLVDDLKKSNDQTEKNAQLITEQRNAIRDSREAAGDLTSGFGDLSGKTQKLNIDLALGKTSLSGYLQGQQAIEQEGRAVSASLDAADKAVRNQEAALRRTTAALLAHADANAKLGIILKNNDGTEKDALQIRREQAAAFNLLPKGIEGSTAALNRSRIANELWGVEARKISAAAAEGAAGIDRLQAAGLRLVPAMTAAQLAVGDKFTGALTNLGNVLSDIKNKFGLAVSPIFTQFLETITELLIQARPSIVSFGETLVTVLGPALNGVGVILNLVGAAIGKIGEGFTGLASLINQVFGTKITGADVFIAVLAALAVAFGPVSVAIGVLSVAVLGLVSTFQAAWPAIKQGATDFAAYIEGSWVGSIVRGISKAIEVVKDLINWFRDLGGARQQASSGGDGGEGFASGGQVHGRPGRDKIPAWLTNREFVHKTAAVDYYGVRFMHAINRMQIPRDMFRGFNLGGLVSIPTQRPLRFASGGQATSGAGMRPLSLTIGADTFAGLLAPEAVAQKLIKAATSRALNSAGRKPSGYGG